MMESVPLPGPKLPGDPAVVEHEAKLVVLSATMSTLRQEAFATTTWASHTRAVTANEQLAAVNLQHDKLVLRMFDAALRSERLDRALQLASRCALVGCFSLGWCS